MSDKKCEVCGAAIDGRIWLGSGPCTCGPCHHAGLLWAAQQAHAASKVKEATPTQEEMKAFWQDVPDVETGSSPIVSCYVAGCSWCGYESFLDLHVTKKHPEAASGRGNTKDLVFDEKDLEYYQAVGFMGLKHPADGVDMTNKDSKGFTELIAGLPKTDTCDEPPLIPEDTNPNNAPRGGWFNNEATKQG